MNEREDISPLEEDVDFGYRRVKVSEKVRLVQDVFAHVAPHYDFMNDAMSLGIHRVWKKRFVNLISPRPGQKILDLGGGTGDIAFRIQDLAHRQAEVVVCDINPGMLEVGQKRAQDKGYVEGLSWVEADATTLPFESQSFDTVVSAFCFRNIALQQKAMEEVYRVLKPRGRFWCLEFSTLTEPSMQKAYDLWSFEVIPRLGRFIAKNEDAYRYLSESIRRHPSQKAFANIFRAAGFSDVMIRNFAMGIVAVHEGTKPSV